MTTLLKQLDKQMKEQMKQAGDAISGDVRKAYEANSEELMERIIDKVTEGYKIHYHDEDTINIKVDRRKNISSIEMDIRETVEEIVGGKNISDILFKYRTLDGMIIIERRR